MKTKPTSQSGIFNPRTPSRSPSNSYFFARVKNRLGSSARLGLTALAGLALAVAVSASSSKNAAQSKKSTAVDAASYAGVAASSKSVAAQSGPSTAAPVVSSAQVAAPICPPCPLYVTATSQDVFVPATTDIGNHCDDC